MNLSARQHISTSVQYNGLKNQGATCYLNSVLQALFMTKDFREAVERHNCENPHTDCFDCHLKTLFKDLKGSKADTNNITRKLGIDRVYQQQDAAEYFEKILRMTSPDASQIFHGQLTHKTKCRKCETESGTDEKFWHLPLALVESFSEDYSVMNGIEEYFRDSYFSGENQMYCDQCDDKSDAATKCVIKHHPEVLMLLLKRFEFDFMTYVKIDCTVDVPYTLQIPQNQTYELYAVVDHFGDIRSGHYTATIKSQDDDRWYKFNDTRVTLLDYQPLQVDNFEKSRSAYLLFYRKRDVLAADACTQHLREVSTPGDFPPVNSEISDQCQDAVKMRERGEGGGASEGGNDISIDSKEETGIKDKVSVGSPDLCHKVEGQDNLVYTRQDIPYNNQESNEERNDSHSHLQDAQAEKQRDEEMEMFDNREDMEGNAEADDQAEKKENVSREFQLEDTVKDQDNGSGRPDDVRHVKPEVSDRHATHGHLNKQDEMSVAQMRVMDGKTGDDEPSEKKRKHLDRVVEHQDHQGLVDVRQNMKKDLGGAQEVGQDVFKPVSVDKQGDEERMKMVVNVDKEEETGADEGGMASGKEKLCNEFQNKGRVGESEQNVQKEDQKCKQQSKSKKHEHQREKKRDVQGVKEQKRGDDNWQDVEDQISGGRDDVRQNQSEQKTSVTHTRREDVGVVKQATEQEIKRGEHVHNRADFSLRRAGRGGLKENQGVGEVEKRRTTELNENTVEDKCGSEQSKDVVVKIIEEEMKDGVQTSSETKYINIQTVRRTSQDDIKSSVKNNEGNVERKSDPIDAKVSLPKRFGSLNLSVTRKRKVNRVTGNVQEDERNSTIHSKTNKRQKFSTDEMKHAVNERAEKKKRWQGRKEKSKRKHSKNKFLSCFSCKSQKYTESSESDEDEIHSLNRETQL